MKQAQGFVAGTLVHTDKGLVPIEQIKVGDMVLSKPESGESDDVNYQKVKKTYGFLMLKFMKFHMHQPLL